MEVKWRVEAQNELKKAFNVIAKDSPQNALNVINDILDTANKLVKNPEMYPPDKYKSANTGNWRAFKVHRYRVSCYVGPNEIVIAA